MKLSDYTPLFVDFETFTDKKDGYFLRGTGGKGLSTCEYVRDERFKAHGVGLSCDGVVWYTKIDKQGMSTPWQQYMLVAHNAKFDTAILAWHYGIIPGLYMDTMALSRAVIGGRIPRHDLGTIAAYLGLPPKGDAAMKFDGIRDLTPEQDEELATYCKNDVVLCQAIYDKLIPQFPDNQLVHMDWTIRAFVQPLLGLDIAHLQEGVDDEIQKRGEIIKRSGISLDVLASSKRFAEELGRRGIATPKKRSKRTGKETAALSVGDIGFLSIREQAPDLIAARMAAKSTIRSTRGEKLIKVGITGPWPFDVQFSGATQTHRYSGGNGAGGNPQNFPRTGFIRESVCAPSGHVLVVGDFSAIEMRILAYLACEPKLIGAIETGKDVYSEFASAYYKKPINKHDHPEERKFGKESILGLGYGMGWRKFKDRVLLVLGHMISDQEAKEAVYLYRRMYTVPILWTQAEMALQWIYDENVQFLQFAPFIKIEKECLVLPSGLRLQYPGLRKDSKGWVYDVYQKTHDKETTKLYGGKLIENICQALAGEICKFAIQRAEESGLNVAGQCHDEIICVAKENNAERNREDLENAMTSAIPFWPEIKLSAEVSIGKNWAEAKQ